MVKYVTHTQNILSSYCRVYQATHTHTHRGVKSRGQKVKVLPCVYSTHGLVQLIH